MQKTIRRQLTRIAAAVLLAVLLFAAFFAGQAMPRAAAATASNFAETNVLDDLMSSSDEDGNAFDITDFPYNDHGRVQLITFAEYCYSYAANMRTNYGLYLYIYNPTGQEIAVNSALNKVQLAVSYNDRGAPDEYEQFGLRFCNQSTGNYNNLFYKFRVIDHESADGLTIAQRVNSNARRYDVSGIYLLTQGESNASAYTVGGSYIYSGYAAGYGPDANAASTLDCDVTELEVLETTVHGTEYRPEGDFYNGEQDQLNSVFFSVPNYFFEEYGEISSIKARWDEYRTNPVFVTQTAQAAAEIAQYIGLDASMTGYSGAIGAFTERVGIGHSAYNKYKWFWNAPEQAAASGIENKNVLAAVFDTNGTYWQDYGVSGAALQEQLLGSSQKLGGPLINDKYSEVLFSDQVDEGHSRGENIVTVDSDYRYSLTSYKISQNFWQQIFGGHSVTSNTYDDILAIEFVEASDLDGKDDADVARALYIGESDVQALRDEVAAAQSNDETVVLFRFAVSTYFCYPAIYAVEYDDEEYPKFVYSDAYVAEETVFLDFTLIQVTFFRDGSYTAIPVVSDPVDLIGDITPPLELPEGGIGTGAGGCAAFNWKGFLIIAALVLLAVLLLVLFFKYFVGKSSVKINISDGGGSGGRSASASSDAKRAEAAAARAEKSAKAAKSSADKAKKSTHAKKSGKNSSSSKTNKRR